MMAQSWKEILYEGIRIVKSLLLSLLQSIYSTALFPRTTELLQYIIEY